MINNELLGNRIVRNTTIHRPGQGKQQRRGRQRLTTTIVAVFHRVHNAENEDKPISRLFFCFQILGSRFGILGDTRRNLDSTIKMKESFTNGAVVDRFNFLTIGFDIEAKPLTLLDHWGKLI